MSIMSDSRHNNLPDGAIIVELCLQYNDSVIQTQGFTIGTGDLLGFTMPYNDETGGRSRIAVSRAWIFQ